MLSFLVVRNPRPEVLADRRLDLQVLQRKILQIFNFIFLHLLRNLYSKLAVFARQLFAFAFSSNKHLLFNVASSITSRIASREACAAESQCRAWVEQV